jgi:hypothetical protein
MAVIHYFQRYSQRENVITNNTLLLLARFYELSPDKFQRVLNGLLQKEVEVGVSFTQQNRREGEGSVPDGLISQRSFQIVIEAKRGNDFRSDQLIAHLNCFTEAEQHFLIAIGATPPSEQQLDEVRIVAKTKQSNIEVLGVSYAQLIELVGDEIDDRDYEMNRLWSDYQDFCAGEGLISDDKYLMRLVLANKSRDENLKFNIYYDQRGFREHKYIGLYGGKTVYAIGEIENIVDANLVNKELVINWSKSEVQDDQKQRIREIIKYVMENRGWDIRLGSHFFFVKEFVLTDYKKSTPRAPMGTKFFNLKNILKRDILPPVADIASLLRKETWSEQTR